MPAMTALKTLVLEMPDGLTDITLPPNLQTLQIGFSQRYREPIVTPSELTPILYHPTLKSLILTWLTVRDAKSSAASSGYDGVVSKISSLTFNKITAEPAAATKILGVMGALTHSVYRGTVGIRDDFERARQHHLLKDINPTLQLLQQSLEEVSLVYKTRWRYNLDSSLLDFKGFPNLTKLTIDPSLLIGRKVCPVDCAWYNNPYFDSYRENYLGPEEITSRLPSSLEELHLVIDREQAARVPRYRQDMLDSLYRALPTFPALRRITLSDPWYTQGHAQCFGDRFTSFNLHGTCPIPYGYQPRKKDHRPQNIRLLYMSRFPGLRKQRLSRIKKYKKEFQVVGVELVIIQEET
jgi:hypothetical protein